MYIDLHKWNERYEVEIPIVSTHNLIVGDLYLDVGGSMTVRKVYHDGFSKPMPEREETAVINFYRRGWFSKEACKCEGEVTYLDGMARKKAFKIFGHWNEKLFIQDLRTDTAEPEQVWERAPLPDNWRYMYGLSHFSLQLNYFPKRLQNLVAPTDTRRR
jgi:hypothetical protein